MGFFANKRGGLYIGLALCLVAAVTVGAMTLGRQPAAEEVKCGGEVILFSRVTCPNCKVAENLLSKAGVAYRKLIADENVDLCREYGVKGAPTLVITDGEAHQNFYSVPEIKKYLAAL